LLIAFFLLSAYSYITQGIPFPYNATASQWGWLILSGLTGFVIGDLLLFQALVVVGARIAMLIMSLAPPITAIIGWIFLGEHMSIKEIFGMLITIGGIILVVLRRENKRSEKEGFRKIAFHYPVYGLLLALGGAIGQGLGLVLSKKGMNGYDPFLSTQIRVIAAIFGFSIVFTFWKKWGDVKMAIKNKIALSWITLGAFFGPFLGVSLSLMSIQYTSTGVASTIMAIVPILVIPASIFLFKEKVTIREVIGSIISVIGVAIFFI
ncbi:MAG: DMT family transporter, partial [Bacteroidota bacterium]|nr:DMT family transporter [Bacteroidota bacterium]